VVRSKAPGTAAAAGTGGGIRDVATAKALGHVSRSTDSMGHAFRAGVVNETGRVDAEDVRICVEAALHLDLPTSQKGERTGSRVSAVRSEYCWRYCLLEQNKCTASTFAVSSRLAAEKHCEVPFFVLLQSLCKAAGGQVSDSLLHTFLA
jgi:hypothetical protein